MENKNNIVDINNDDDIEDSDVKELHKKVDQILNEF